MLIYVSHPYSGKEENKLAVEEIVRNLAVSDPDNTYVSPIHCFGFLYNDVSYEAGMNMCLDLLEKCDRMIICNGWENSRGCKTEVEYAKEKGIPFTFYECEG